MCFSDPVSLRRTRDLLRVALFATFLPFSMAPGQPTAVLDDVLVTQGVVEGSPVVLVADKATGLLNYRAADGSTTASWTGPFDSGLESLTGLAAGILDHSGDSYAVVTSATGNRIHLVPLRSGAVAAPLFARGVGPGPVTTVDLSAGSDGDPIRDIVLATRFNDANRGTFEGWRNAGAIEFGEAFTEDVAGRFVSLHPIPVPGDPLILANLERPEGERQVFLLALSPGGSESRLDWERPPRSRILGAPLGGEGLFDLLSYVPGATEFTLAPVTGSPSDPELGEPVNASLPCPIGRIVPISPPPGAELLVTCTQGGEAYRVTLDEGRPDQIDTVMPPSGFGDIAGAFPLNEGFLLLSDGSPAGYAVFSTIGGTPSLTESGTLPAGPAFAGRANLFLFDDSPFSGGGARLLGRLRVSDWSLRADLEEGGLNVLSQPFKSPSDGLTGILETRRGPVPDNIAFVLANQVDADTAVAGLSPPGPLYPVSVDAVPEPGNYRRTIAVTLTVDQPGAEILYRLGNGTWEDYRSPIQLFRDTDLQVRAVVGAGNVQSPIRTLAYRFSTPPGDRDRDGDGVPDFVEIARGLDPGSGADADGDGVSDLEELLGGTDPGDGSDFPDPMNRTPLDLANSFDLLVSAAHRIGVSAAEERTAEGEVFSVHTVTGRRLARAETASRGHGSLPDPSARFANLFAAGDEPFLIVATPASFHLSGDADGDPSGRRLVGVVPFPVLEPPEIAFSLGNDALDAEASAWIAAAQSGYAGVERTEVTVDLGPANTLVALLLERVLNNRLRNGGGMSAAEASFATSAEARPELDRSLFSFTGRDPGLEAFSEAQLVGFDPAAGADLDALVRKKIADAVEQGAVAGSADLLTLVRQIYGAHAAFNDEDVAATEPPLAALRDILAGNPLAQPYGNALTLSQDRRDDAQSAIDALLAMPDRPTGLMLRLFVTMDSFAGETTTLEDGGGNAYSLFEPDGDRLEIATSTPLRVDAELFVVGREMTARSSTVPGTAMAVDSVILQAAPRPAPGDSDGDLLADSWERAVRGDLDSQPFENDDSDAGYSNLQEFFEGTDPGIGSDQPAGEVVDVGPPVLEIGFTDDNRIRIFWDYPADYADNIGFRLQRSTNLPDGFNAPSENARHLGNGQFELILDDNQTADSRQYRMTMGLR